MLKKSSKAIVDEALKEISTLGLKEVKTLIDEKACTLVDLRDIREIYNEGGIADALHIPRGFLEFWVDPESPYYQKDRFDDNKKILLFCAMGQRSALATKTLQDMGFVNVAHIEGGYKAMAASGIFHLTEIRKKK